MLKRLTIRNYALIKELEMHPSGNLNVITGETGAGKSIMLGAVGLLLGNRADTKVLLNDHDKCVAEAEFDISAYALKDLIEAEDLDYDQTLILRREINTSGKSRAFINDTPVTLDVLKKIGARLVDVHSQHETLQLSTQLFQLNLIDAYANTEEQLKVYKQNWNNFQRLKKELKELEENGEKIKAEADFIRFQFEELDKAALNPGEQEQLEKDVKLAEHAEEIKLKLNQALDLLERGEFSAQGVLANLKSVLQSITTYSSDFQKLFERVESILIEARDIKQELESEEEQIDFNEEKTNEIRERLSLIYQLQKKHRVNHVEELINIRNELELKAQKADNLDEEINQLKIRLAASEKSLFQEAEKLSKLRTKVLPDISKKIQALLHELGMPQASFSVLHEAAAPGPLGKDYLDFTFSANKGVTPQPIANVASGGEFSRLMFCIKHVLANKTSMPTIIFDEIDSGVSGEIALKLGRLMKMMAQKHQVISISHLPQIAAKATTHYFVYKDNTDKQTVSRIKQLNEADRTLEIAKMIAGEQPSPAALESARELMLQ